MLAFPLSSYKRTPSAWEDVGPSHAKVFIWPPSKWAQLLPTGCSLVTLLDVGRRTNVQVIYIHANFLGSYDLSP